MFPINAAKRTELLKAIGISPELNLEEYPDLSIFLEFCGSGDIYLIESPVCGLAEGDFKKHSSAEDHSGLTCILSSFAIRCFESDTVKGAAGGVVVYFPAYRECRDVFHEKKIKQMLANDPILNLLADTVCEDGLENKVKTNQTAVLIKYCFVPEVFRRKNVARSIVQMIDDVYGVRSSCIAFCLPHSYSEDTIEVIADPAEKELSVISHVVYRLGFSAMRTGLLPSGETGTIVVRKNPEQ